ncbi:hypothetical protein [Prevotella histicola]|uniref:hypothetical protein n=1 Tax=Prevotella histicola TaxID=470565 RepID=UPI0028EE37B8|nr:hypothetical protein [Prevotella histicola]
MIFPIVLDKRDSSRRRPNIRTVASSPTRLLSPIASSVMQHEDACLLKKRAR